MQEAIICVHYDAVILEQLEALIQEKYSTQYVIETATNPNEALDVIENLKNMGIVTAICITALGLNEMDGITFMKQVQIINPKAKCMLLYDKRGVNILEPVINTSHIFRVIKPISRKEELLQPMQEAIDFYNHEKELEILYKKLQESEREKNLILESIAEGMIFIDEYYNILWMNEVARQDLKRGDSSEKCYELLYGKNSPCSNCECTKILSGLKYHMVERSLDNGDYRLIKYFPVNDHDGKTLGILMYITDITNKKRIEMMNYALLDVAKAVSSCDNSTALYQNIYHIVKTNFPLVDMCIAGKDYDSVYLEYVHEYKKEHKEELHKQQERMKDLMSVLSRQIQKDPNNNYVINEMDQVVEYAIIQYGRLMFFVFEAEKIQNDLMLKFIKSLSEQIKIGLTKIENLKKIIYQAHHDSLTGLYNREFFMKTANGKIFCQRENETPSKYCALAVMDLNFFKEVNDTHGHILGDEVLFVVAQRIQKALRHGDIVARIGGDEFAMLIEHTNKNEVAKVLDRIQDAVARPIKTGKVEVCVGSSIGVICDIGRYSHSELAFRDADIAMYEAKRYKDGIGCYRFFEKEVQDRVQKQLELEYSLSAPYLNKSFGVRYQPIISLDTFEVVGYEALIRWTSEKGTLYPSEFIPIAEESNSIDKIGDFVLEEVNYAIKQFNEKFEKPCFISINLSSKQLFSLEQLEKIERLGFHKNHLQIDVTEKALLSNFDKAKQSIDKLNQMGIKVHLDDFGTGVSSLNYLNSAQFNDIKIDRTFVSKLPDHPECLKATEVILAVASHLGLTVTAEGVENEAQLERLIELGCNFAQGYLFSRPLELEEALQFNVDPLLVEKYYKM